MRIVGGLLRGRRIEAPEIPSTRPTTDRVRESLFNILESIFQEKGLCYENLTFLDAFAGSGALGIEALSRGASFAGFIEQNQDAFHTIQHNLERLHLKKRSYTYRRDVLRPGPFKSLKPCFPANKDIINPPQESTDVIDKVAVVKDLDKDILTQKNQGFHVAFLDPPYGKDLGPKALQILIRYNWLAQDSLIVLEIGEKEIFTPIEGFDLLDQRLYGATQLLFLTREPIN